MAAIKDLPPGAYAWMVTHHYIDPDSGYDCVKCVELKEGKLKRYRFFDPDTIPAHSKINDYAWFDGHPELVMFEGWMADDGRMELTKK